LVNVLEVTPVKASHRPAFAAVGLLVGLAAGAGAQATRQVPPPDAPRLVVTTFKAVGGDKNLGVQAAEAVRDRVQKEIPIKQLYVLPKTDYNKSLETYGYSTVDPLSPNDARELAKLLRADEIIDGTATRTPGGYRLDARLTLARSTDLVQPLPPAEASKLSDAAAKVAKDLQAARKQLDANRKCENALRASNYQEAIADANQAIAAYPQSTLGRLCLASAYDAMKMPPDSIIRVTREIRALDPRNKIALGLAAKAFKAQQATDSTVAALVELAAADPTNLNVIDNVVAEMALSGHPEQAIPLINKAVAENPGDQNLVNTQFKILFAASDWKGALKAGEELAKLDTAAVDSAFFYKMSTAYANDSQPQKASEVLARAVAKYPNSAYFLTRYAAAQQAAGQLQPALATYTRAITVDPKSPAPYMQVAQMYAEMKQYDSAYTTIQRARAAKSDSAMLGQAALVFGNQLFKAANASKNRDDFQRAIRFLALSDSIAPSPTAKFLLGVSAFSVGQSAATDAPKAKSCQLARLAQDMFLVAQVNIPAGAAGSPEFKDAASQYMQYLPQFTPVVDRQVKVFCKGAAGR
jgi:tetratricopeptide (TPR) repeat protein